MSRYQRNRAAGVVDRAIALPRDPETNDALAEAAEHYVLDPYGFGDLVDERGPRPCDWWVIHDVKGRAVRSCGDVKWTPLESGGLMVAQAKVAAHRCTVYCLVVGEPPRTPFRLVGWEYGYRLELSPDPGKARVPSWYIPQDALRSPESFRILMASMFGATRR